MIINLLYPYLTLILLLSCPYLIITYQTQKNEYCPPRKMSMVSKKMYKFSPKNGCLNLIMMQSTSIKGATNMQQYTHVSNFILFGQNGGRWKSGGHSKKGKCSQKMGVFPQNWVFLYYVLCILGPVFIVPSYKHAI